MSLHSHLSSLPLRNPLRPAPVLSSPSWCSTLQRSQLLGLPAPANFSHAVVPNHYGHTGCVNALNWESGGERLVSGGDDTKVCIWKVGAGRRQDSQEGVPSLDLGLTDSIDTGHTNNIFDVTFAPTNSSRLISCAGDREIRIYDLAASTSQLVTSPTNQAQWNHHDQSTCTQVLRCHTNRVKRIQTEQDSSDVFLTCSEDGTVRQHDLRNSHACPPRRRGDLSTRTACGPPLISYEGMRIYSLTVSPLRPYLLALGGSSPFVFLHDRRMLRGEMMRDWDVEMREGEFTQCVRRFTVPPYASLNPNKPFRNTVVATAFGAERDLIVSYSDESIYLFNTDDAPSTSLPQLQTHRPTKIQRLDSSSSSSDSELTESKEEEIFIVHPKKRFSGHLNTQTVKSVNYVFGDEHLISGSDDGNFFIWSKSSPSPHQVNQGEEEEGEEEMSEGELVGIYKGDENVVNVMESHPTLPFLAISGIDNTIKLYSPSPPLPLPFTSESRKGLDNLINEKKMIISRNQEVLDDPRNEGGGIGVGMTEEETREFFLMLGRRLGRIPPGLVTGEGGEGEEGEGEDGEECVIT